MIVSIHQPNYLPWLGYFRKILQSEIFVFFDNVQMPMGKSYVTRCQVKSPSGAKWLTVPTPKLGSPSLISETPYIQGPWLRKHLGSIKNWYPKSLWAASICDIIESAEAMGFLSIARFNGFIIMEICQLLGAQHVKFVWASDVCPEAVGAESILPILLELHASDYITGTGSGSKRYLDSEVLESHNIKTSYLDNDFPEHGQLHGEFISGLSIIDAILNLGPESTRAILEMNPE